MGYWCVHNVYFQVGVDGSASATYDDKGVSVIYSYSHSKGLYGGLGLDGKIVLEQQGVNEAFYDKKGVTSKQILDGEVDEGMPKNEDYEMILDVLEKVMDDDIMLEQVAPDNLNAHQTIVDKSKE